MIGVDAWRARAARWLSPFAVSPRLVTLAVVVVAFVGVVFAKNILYDADTFWHVAAGNWILDHRAVPQVDIFSYSKLGQTWHAHEWLSEVVMALAFRGGGWGGVVLLTAAAGALAAGLMSHYLARWLWVIPRVATLGVVLACVNSRLFARPHIISLPLCNLYLQGRARGSADVITQVPGPPLTPRWRGITLLHEFMEAGVTVACGSDNVRDAFYAWGDLDAMEVYQESIRIAHLDTRLAASAAVVTTGPARIMGLHTQGYGTVAPGAPADLVVFPARTFNELLARPAADRRLIHGEAFRPRIVPEYAEPGDPV